VGVALAAGFLLDANRARRPIAGICVDRDALQVDLQKPFTHHGGLMYEATVRSDTWNTPRFLKHPLLGNMRIGPSDTPRAPRRSTVILCEDDRPLGPPHSTNMEIYHQGKGRYSHYSPFGILFSTTDGSDPNNNGRRYRAIEP
jgi:hypothetical protein